MINFYIPHKKKGEKIILLLRRYSLVLLMKMGFWVVVALMPVLVFFILGGASSPIFSNPQIAPIVALFITIYYLYICLFVLYSFVDYYLDVWIVTTDRIVNIEQKGLFHRIISEQQLHRIQDVTSETKGVLHTFLNFGDVHIQTAAEQARFEFKQIKHPERAAKKIVQLVEKRKKFYEMMSQKDEIHTR